MLRRSINSAANESFFCALPPCLAAIAELINLFNIFGIPFRELLGICLKAISHSTNTLSHAHKQRRTCISKIYSVHEANAFVMLRFSRKELFLGSFGIFLAFNGSCWKVTRSEICNKFWWNSGVLYGRFRLEIRSPAIFLQRKEASVSKQHESLMKLFL